MIYVLKYRHDCVEVFLSCLAYDEEIINDGEDSANAECEELQNTEADVSYIETVYTEISENE